MRVVDKAKTYGAYLPDQDFLLPPSLKDWLPEHHLAYFVSDVVDQLDPSAIESRSGGGGKEGEAAGTGQAGEKGSI